MDVGDSPKIRNSMEHHGTSKKLGDKMRQEFTPASWFDSFPSSCPRPFVAPPSPRLHAGRVLSAVLASGPWVCHVCPYPKMALWMWKITTKSSDSGVHRTVLSRTPFSYRPMVLLNHNLYRSIEAQTLQLAFQQDFHLAFHFHESVPFSTPISRDVPTQNMS